jgi:hypothetical protein
MSEESQALPSQITGMRDRALGEIEQYILAYSAAAYGALYAADPSFREDVSDGGDAIIGNAMKMAVRHLELVQELRLQMEES